jgi:hypothetical protein
MRSLSRGNIHDRNVEISNTVIGNFFSIWQQGGVKNARGNQMSKAKRLFGGGRCPSACEQGGAGQHAVGQGSGATSDVEHHALTVPQLAAIAMPVFRAVLPKDGP